MYILSYFNPLTLQTKQSSDIFLAMAEVEREKIELELGLSIRGRGSFGKYKTTKKPNIGFNLETREISTSPAPAPEREVLDAKTKREIHAMRRQEAKKKRQEKRNRGLRNSNNVSPVTEDQNQDRDDEQRASKKRRVYPYPSFQFVPYTNGFPYPYMMMPWWTPNAGSTLKNAVQPMPCRVGFGPFNTGSDLGSDKSGEKTQGEDRKTTSYGGYTSSSTQIYISTKGEGPNGKRFTGFLYRYAKSEVNIVCVCRGTAFSPAEFVEHAGCTDVSTPLKHITVIPSE
ncbi:ninja-family protein AFP3-like [Cannabis sativa]|uniref:ninja-family protein AFP3-like n=1 Tax=Cannabis sativa TaxID=3483 RepID=UPI0029CA006E|nr:ninja-family protein AFP3-like [Cannabis sativa]